MYLFRNFRFAPLWAIAMIGLAMLIAWNSAEYFLAENAPLFLIEKLPISRNAIWLTAFRLHVVSACICLAAGFPLFFPSLLKYRRSHLMLGYIYFNSVLWLAAPTGLMMSPFAKGGWVAAAGFAVTGLAWWMFTWCGYVAIRRRDVETHVRWMVRSFSIALSAIFFRLIQNGLGWLSVDPEINYIASLWLSLFVSIWLAETCIGTTWTTIRGHSISLLCLPFISRMRSTRNLTSAFRLTFNKNTTFPKN